MAAKPAPAAQAGSRRSAASNGTPACGSCGKALTKAQQELSIRNYGEALCPGCQKDKSAPAGPGGTIDARHNKTPRPLSIEAGAFCCVNQSAYRAATRRVWW